MKQLLTLIAVAIAITLSNTAHAFSQMEVEDDMSTNIPTFRFFTVKPVTGPVGVFGWGVATKGWGQAYTGVDLNPIKGIDVGYGWGVETFGDGHREGGYAIANYKEFTAKHFFESGASGEFHKSELDYQATDRINLGYVNHKFLGNAAKIEYKLDKAQTLRVTVYKDRTLASLVVNF